jgi:YebC/PmpR family DNA-binding regulatory protein
MSGHSKWSQIKRQKGVADVKRGLLFTKLAREIVMSAKQGGGDPAGNARLRLAIQRARDGNMPVDNIERAIKRGSGEGAGAVDMVEIVYEGYSAGGAAVYVQVMTDNRNRSVSDVRRVFTRNGGSLGESGSVAWLFESRGVISAEAGEAGEADEDSLTMAAIDAEAEDVKTEGEGLEVYASAERLEAVRAALEEHGATIATAEMQMVPTTLVPLNTSSARQTLRLLDLMEELEDVQKVYTNADFPDEVLAEVAS